jgi:hypothetical protein
VPMWFGLLDEDKSAEMIAQLSDSSHQTDWGMRIISGQATRYSGGGYHYGSVWPLFTGWASVGEYRYHHQHPAYANLRANALLALDGSPGHVTEVLSGDYYQGLSTSSPHQIWSAAMVVAPVLRGMLGLSTDAQNTTLTLAPHLPADWPGFIVHTVKVGDAIIDLTYAKTSDSIELEIKNTGTKNCALEFDPSVSLRARILAAEAGGHAVPFHIQKNGADQHIITRVSAPPGATKLRIRIANDFGVSYQPELPQLGSPSEGLRILSETWTDAKDELTLSTSGSPEQTYELSLSNPSDVSSVDGAELVRYGDSAWLHITTRVADNHNTAHATVTIHFAQRNRHNKSSKHD